MDRLSFDPLDSRHDKHNQQHHSRHRQHRQDPESASRPILPLMTTQAGLTPQAAGALATAMRGRSRPGAVRAEDVPAAPRRPNCWFAVLFVSYTLEGIG